MLIIDSFNHQGKTAIYCRPDNDTEITPVSALIGEKVYKIIMYDKLKSLNDVISFTFLLDTDDEIKTNQQIILQ